MESENGKPKRTPREGVNLPLPDAYERYVKETPIGQRIEESELFARWDEFVGPTISAHFQPMTFRDGVLTVQFQNHTWAQEMQWKKARLVSALNDRLGRPCVREVRFKFGRRPAMPSLQPRGRATANPTPQPPPLEAIISIADPELRHQFEKLARLIGAEAAESVERSHE